MNRNHQKYIFIFLSLAVIAAAVILILVLTRPGHKDTQITEGLEYIRSMESMDVNAVEKEVNAVRQSLLSTLSDSPSFLRIWTKRSRRIPTMSGLLWTRSGLS